VQAFRPNTKAGILAALGLFLLLSVAKAETTGVMQPYREVGTYSIAGGNAKLVIEKDSTGRLQYQVEHQNRNGLQTGGSSNFIKTPAFFVFPEDSDHYWIFDGKSEVIHFTFSDHGMTQEDLSTLPSHFRHMPEQALKLLPPALQKKIRSQN
jgi:hypothetical protein